MSSRLTEEDAAIVLVDFQEKFAPAVAGFEEAAANGAVLAACAIELRLPLVVTEQYPKGLGRTVEEVSTKLGGCTPLEKTEFSASRAEGFDIAGRSAAVVCGVEAHVCVAQTALDLIDDGLSVHVAADAVASRDPRDRDTALDRLQAAGAVITSTEAIVFELLGGAGHPSFKTIQGLIK